jgi:transcriptional accessory protein Tex/SPT6
MTNCYSTKLTKKEKLDNYYYAEKKLNELLNRKQEIYSIIRHVSQSGMTRHISFFIIHNNEIWHIDNLISDYLDYRPNKRYDALVVGGCGMDMAFSVVHHLQEQMKHSKNTTFINYDFRHRII